MPRMETALAVANLFYDLFQLTFAPHGIFLYYMVNLLRLERVLCPRFSQR